ncbi:hypothetical protein [Labrys neptuniae]|uniref:Uncharacterized protein n=1 Tax=Labrys neptuniae TaxID=376174 RepID=A0ABV3PFZ4_9HYPH
MTHFARADDELECAQCGMVASGDTGEWRKNLPDTPTTVKETETGDVKVTDLNSMDAAIKRILRNANPDQMFALIVVNNDGSLSVWGRTLHTDDQREWFDHKMADAKAFLSRG